MKTNRAPTHPGKLLKGELEEMEISVTQAAKDLDISRNLLHGILAETKPISSESAVKIGKYLGNGGGLWSRMQAAYDLYQAEKKMVKTVKQIPAAAWAMERRV